MILGPSIEECSKTLLFLNVFQVRNFMIHFLSANREQVTQFHVFLLGEA